MPKHSDSVEKVIQAISIKYNNIVYELKQKGEDIIVFSLGEAFFDIPLFSFNDLPYPDLYHYSHSRGISDFRQKLSEYFFKKYDFEFDPATNIIITAGSKAAIHMSFMSILNPGDEAIVYEPYWVSYTEQIKLCYGIPVNLPHEVSIFDTEKYITPKTKIIVLNNPNNPQGKVLTPEEVSHLLSLAKKYDIYLVSDEAYSEFVLHPDDFVSLGKMDRGMKNSVVVNSISKNYGISGWRLGYVITNAELINQILKVNQHLITCPATVLEYYVSKHFYDIIEITRPQIQEVVKKRQRVIEYMDEIGLSYMPGNAAFYIMGSIKPSKLTSDEFCTRLLIEEHVSAVPGIGYGSSCDSHIRLSVGTESWDRTTKGLRTVKSFIDKTK